MGAGCLVAQREIISLCDKLSRPYLKIKFFITFTARGWLWFFRTMWDGDV